MNLPDALAKLEGIMEERAQEIAARAVELIAQRIVQEGPVWSGQWMLSWRFQADYPGMSPRMPGNQRQRASRSAVQSMALQQLDFQIPERLTPGLWYLTTDVDYAADIETQGSIKYKMGLGLLSGIANNWVKIVSQAAKGEGNVSG